MYEMPQSLPEPTSVVTKNGKGPYGQIQRSVTASWVLNPEQVAEGLPAVVVTLTTSHWSERKQYASRLSWETRRTDGAFAVTEWSSSHRSVNVLTKPVARHSLKAMEEAHETAMDLASANFGAGVVETVFEQAAQESGLFEMAEV